MTYPTIVQQMHREFNNASDKLLSEAHEVLTKTNSINFEKINSLRSLGFGKAKEVSETATKITEREASIKVSEGIEYYRRTYPNNKFITHESVMALCTKYNLVFGPVASFTGFVPDKNLKQIKAFTGIKESDESYIITLTEIEFGSSTSKKDKNTMIAFIKSKSNRFEVDSNEYRSIKNRSFDIWQYASLFNKQKDFPEGLNARSIISSVKFDVNKELMICAPEKDFDTSGLTKNGNTFTRLFKASTKPTPPDPVVLKEVKGGYLILTAWGDEASDPTVLNETFN